MTENTGGLEQFVREQLDAGKWRSDIEAALVADHGLDEPAAKALVQQVWDAMQEAMKQKTPEAQIDEYDLATAEALASERSDFKRMLGYYILAAIIIIVAITTGVLIIPF